jgi:tetratricopeptide (TPR) repeat protein
VHASTTERFREGYRNIAERAMLAGWDQPDKDVLRPVYSWLCDETNRWVMIVDNADDLDVFRSSASESHAHDFLKFLPQSPNGSILITSRSRDAAFRMTGSYTDILRVDPMGQERALSLLRNKLGNFEKSDGIQLVEALDFMPLAITQAAAYISQRAPRATLPSYLQSIRNGDRDRAKLLDTDMADSRRDGTSSNSVIATWQISFEHIRRETPSATRLLSLMSLFDRQGIPESLLVGQYQDDADFETDLSVLTDFSLVGVDVDGDQFKMHRLVQFSTRKWMELQGELEGWGKTYVDIMSRNYPLGDFENWKVCQALFPHAQAALACRPADGDALLRWATLLFNAARYAADTGDYNTAAEMLRASLEAREAVLPKDHRKTLFAAMNLGQMLAEQVKYAEAEEILRRTNEIAEQAFGLEDLLTLSASCTLGHVLTLQQKYDEAEGILRQVLTISEKLLGQDNLFTLGVASNLGLALAYQGKYGEAEASIRGVVQTREKLLGPEHPVLIRGTIRLGCVLYFQRRHDEAEIVFRKALDTSERVLGRDHPDTLLSAKSLADVLWSLSRHKPALELYQRAYDGFVRTLGSDHRGTIRCREDCLKAEEFMARKSNDSLSPEPVAEFLFESLTQVD